MNYEDRPNLPPLPPWWEDADEIAESKTGTDPNREWSLVRAATAAVFLAILAALVILLFL
ncbi:hypothetical protein [Nocardia brasiliensis]